MGCSIEKVEFKIRDEKHPQDNRYFSRQADLPLRIGMLLDTSNSIRDRIKFEQDASINFLFSVLRHNKDEAFVMTFDDEPQIVQPFTGDAGALRDQIIKTRAGGGTAIYDAVYPYHVDDLDQSFQDIGDELRNQYSLAYLPTNYVLDGRYHKIRIEVPEHKDYQVRARRGYFARANANVPTTPTRPGGTIQ